MNDAQPVSDADDPVRARLLSRVRRSIEAHSVFQTVRRSEGSWDVGTHPGLLSKVLRTDPSGQTLLMRIEAGHAVPWQQWMPQGAGTCVVELLVLSGALHSKHAHGTGSLGRLDYLLVGLQDTADPLWSTQSTLLLVRVSQAWATPFGEITQGTVVRTNEQRWAPLRRGVRTKVLQEVQDLVSMLVWFEPGATVPSHGHVHDEECLMVDCDLFLGDILLLEGEYQLAPRGTTHAELVSEQGCIVFFHGAVDPVLEDAAWCEAAGQARSA